MSVESFQKGVAQFTTAQRSKRKAEKDERLAAEDKAARLELANIYGSSVEGQTTHGEMSAAGIRSGLIDPNKAAAQLGKMDPNRSAYFLGLKTMQRPELAGVANGSLKILGDIKFTEQWSKEKAKLQALRFKNAVGKKKTRPMKFNLGRISGLVQDKLQRTFEDKYDIDLNSEENAGKPLFTIMSNNAKSEDHEAILKLVDDTIAESVKTSSAFMKDDRNNLYLESVVNAARNTYLSTGNFGALTVGTDSSPVKYRDVTVLVSGDTVNQLAIGGKDLKGETLWGIDTSKYGKPKEVKATAGKQTQTTTGDDGVEDFISQSLSADKPKRKLTFSVDPKIKKSADRIGNSIVKVVSDLDKKMRSSDNSPGLAERFHSNVNGIFGDAIKKFGAGEGVTIYSTGEGVAPLVNFLKDSNTKNSPENVKKVKELRNQLKEFRKSENLSMGPQARSLRKLDKDLAAFIEAAEKMKA